MKLFKIALCSLGTIPFTLFAAEPVVGISVIPQPLKIQKNEGEFTLKGDTKIFTDKNSPDATEAAKHLSETVRRSTGFDLKIEALEKGAPAPKNAILFAAEEAKSESGFEGYTLDSSANGVRISAKEGAGFFYGVQTLLQLLPPEIFAKSPQQISWTLPAVHIEDKPRFAWRGLMLDVSRHFFNKDEIKNFLDIMALHKLNTFHWHLTDADGWRIEIKRYPKLISVGAWRNGIGYGFGQKESNAYGTDGRYGGFFTQDDVREIIAYAKARKITIVPEIEMPGHSSAALRSYPELSCSGKGSTVYCAGNDEAFAFLENILSEVIELFPSKYIHIGGDEVGKADWKKCEKCQARIKQEGLKDENELQSYFIRRMEKFVNSKGRVIIGWDEIIEGGLAPNAAVMGWRGVGAATEAAKTGHDVVMAPTSNCYFDYAQAREGEQRASGFLPLETVYAFEPIPKALPADKAVHILGASGCIWTESIQNYERVQYMGYPRACALSEVCWSPKESKDLKGFMRRLSTHLRRLDLLDVNYRIAPPEGILNAISMLPDGKIEFKSLVPGGEIRYTLDGSAPSRNSILYSGPFKVEQNGFLKVGYFKPAGESFPRPLGITRYCIIVKPYPAIVSSSLEGEHGMGLECAFDGKEDNCFHSNRRPLKDDHITISFASPQTLRHVKMLTGRSNGPKDAIPDGNPVELSSDGKNYREVLQFKDGVADGDTPAEPVKSIRIRVTKESPAWLAICEITLE